MAPAMNPRTVCFCQPIFCMISVSVAPLLRCSIATTWAVLLPSRGTAASCGFAAFLPWGGFLAVRAFWPVFAFAGALLAPRAPRLALGSAFGFARDIVHVGRKAWLREEPLRAYEAGMWPRACHRRRPHLRVGQCEARRIEPPGCGPGSRAPSQVAQPERLA